MVTVRNFKELSDHNLLLLASGENNSRKIIYIMSSDFIYLGSRMTISYLWGSIFGPNLFTVMILLIL
jgi:hypothetical protein